MYSRVNGKKMSKINSFKCIKFMATNGRNSPNISPDAPTMTSKTISTPPSGEACVGSTNTSEKKIQPTKCDKSNRQSSLSSLTTYTAQRYQNRARRPTRI
jgi:hypothetical protein